MLKATGKWWRFDRYELRDGYIRPAPGASLGEFDPWGAYWHHEGHVHFPPYLQLKELVREMRTDRPFWSYDDWKSSCDISEEEFVPDVLDWCRRYGLLGLLPHTVLLVRLETWVAARTANGWVASSACWAPDSGEPREEVVKDEFGAGPIPDDTKYSWWGFFPNALREDLRWETMLDIRREDALSKFRLLPESEAFWKEYAEPFNYFICMARYLANALQVIGDSDNKPVIENGGKPLGQEGAMERLNELTSGVTPVVAVDPAGRHTQTWRSPSVLGHLAMQAVQSLLGGYIRTCHCGTTFATRNAQAKHCSDACGNRFRVKRFYEKHRKVRKS